VFNFVDRRKAESSRSSSCKLQLVAATALAEESKPGHLNLVMVHGKSPLGLSIAQAKIHSNSEVRTKSYVSLETLKSSAIAT
jgi:hypothetical protein